MWRQGGITGIDHTHSDRSQIMTVFLFLFFFWSGHNFVIFPTPHNIRDLHLPPRCLVVTWRQSAPGHWCCPVCVGAWTSWGLGTRLLWCANTGSTSTWSTTTTLRWSERDRNGHSTVTHPYYLRFLTQGHGLVLADLHVPQEFSIAFWLRP